MGAIVSIQSATTLRAPEYYVMLRMRSWETVIICNYYHCRLKNKILYPSTICAVWLYKTRFIFMAKIIDLIIFQNARFQLYNIQTDVVSFTWQPRAASVFPRWTSTVTCRALFPVLKSRICAYKYLQKDILKFSALTFINASTWIQWIG